MERSGVERSTVERSDHSDTLSQRCETHLNKANGPTLHPQRLAVEAAGGRNSGGSGGDDGGGGGGCGGGISWDEFVLTESPFFMFIERAKLTDGLTIGQTLL